MSRFSLNHSSGKVPLKVSTNQFSTCLPACCNRARLLGLEPTPRGRSSELRAVASDDRLRTPMDFCRPIKEPERLGLRGSIYRLQSPDSLAYRSRGVMTCGCDPSRLHLDKAPNRGALEHAGQRFGCWCSVCFAAPPRFIGPRGAGELRREAISHEETWLVKRLLALYTLLLDRARTGHVALVSGSAAHLLRSVRSLPPSWVLSSSPSSMKALSLSANNDETPGP